jgi:hypothetical protein
MKDKEMRYDDEVIERHVEDIAMRWLHGGPRAAVLRMPCHPTRKHRWIQKLPGLTLGQIVLVLERENGRINIREQRTRDIVASVAMS